MDQWTVTDHKLLQVEGERGREERGKREREGEGEGERGECSIL